MLTTDRHSIPMPQGGASLKIAFRCTKKKVLVIGYDEIAANRVLSALDADAMVALVGPLDLMCKELMYRVQRNQIEWLGSQFEEEQLIGNHLVFVARSDDIELCQTISNACFARRIPVNVANQKELSDFDMTCSYRDQSLQVAVSTNGLSSVNLAHRILQSKISCLLSPELGEAVKNVGWLRKEVEKLDSAPASNVRRYQWLSDICENTSLQHLASLSKSDMKEILDTYHPGDILELSTCPIPVKGSSNGDFLKNNACQNEDLVLADENLKNNVDINLLDKQHQLQVAPTGMNHINLVGIESKEVRSLINENQQSP